MGTASTKLAPHSVCNVIKFVSHSIDAAKYKGVNNPAVAAHLDHDVLCVVLEKNKYIRFINKGQVRIYKTFLPLWKI